VKTLYSKKWMPIDPILAELLLQHKARTATGAKDTDWLFVNLETGNRTDLDACRNITWFRREKRPRSGALVGTHFVIRTQLFSERSVWTLRCSKNCYAARTFEQP
jgi:hypothetical protein